MAGVVYQTQNKTRNCVFQWEQPNMNLMSHSAVYVEFGATSSDTIALTHTLGSTTSTLKWNILAQQIPCTANYRCHKFLVQKGTKIVLVWTNDLKGHRQTACNGSPEPQGLCTATTMLEARSGILSIKFIIGGIGRRIQCIYTLHMLPVHQLARLHELHPNWGRVLWDRVEGEEWDV